MLNKYLTIFLLLLFFIILSEKVNLEIILLGLLLSILVYFSNENLINISSFKKIFFLKYIYILIKEIVIANIQVAKIVLSPKIYITPEIVTYKTKLKSRFNKVLLANSITLTPGTLTVFIHESTLTVHCLKKEYVEEVLNSKFEKILLKTEV